MEPDLLRDPFPSPRLPLGTFLGGLGLQAAYTLLHPELREPFVSPRPAALSRLYYRSRDGWQAPLYRLPSSTGGEPVLLAHGLGGSALDFSLDSEISLAEALRKAGYSVYLWEHRADRSAIAPEHAGPFSADDVALADLDAAMDLVREDSGFPRLLWIGHGLGAQLLLLRLGLSGREGVAAGVYMQGAVRFPTLSSSGKIAGRVAELLPQSWILPGRRVQQLLSPWATESALHRGRLVHASGDLHAGLLRQIGRWFRVGHLCDSGGRIDIVEALERQAALVVQADGDPFCAFDAMEPAVEKMGAFRLKLEGGWGHLDSLVDRRAPVQVHQPILQFLEVWRRRCW